MRYTKKDLLDLLERHSGKHIEPCDCECPYTGNSIDILYQFVGVEHDLPSKFITDVRELYKKSSKNTCFDGKSRLVNAAAVMYIVSLLWGRSGTQQDIGKIFYVSDAAIRERYKEIVRSNKIEIQV